MDFYFIVYIVCIGCSHFAAGSYTVERLGCYRDSDQHVLTGDYRHLTDNSPSKCIDICAEKGFQLAGLHDTYYCLCGNVVPKSKVYDSECYRPCPEDSSFKCGSPWDISVYRIIMKTQNLGCYRDSSEAPLLSGHHRYLYDNTPSKCIALCTEKGFQLAGVQVPRNCFCGNDVPTRKILSKLCDMPCPEDSTLKCGGFMATNVYLTGVTISSSTVPPTTISPQETECMGLMDWKFLNVVLNNENTCQYRCINKLNKKAISIFKTDGEICNNGKGICIKEVCHDSSSYSECPEGFQGVKKICKLHCLNVLDYPGSLVEMNIEDGDPCIIQNDHHGTCLNGKCVISLEGQINTTSEM